MTRTNAREIVVHLIYGMNYTKETANEAVVMRFADDYYETLIHENDIYEGRPDTKQMDYIKTVLAGIGEKQEELDSYIIKHAIGWNIDRISKLTKAIMQLAMYEVLYVEDVPMSAAINEAIELTRKYEDEDMVAFVNGILGSFSREDV